MQGRQRGLVRHFVIIQVVRALALIEGNPAVVNISLDCLGVIAVQYQRAGSDSSSMLRTLKILLFVPIWLYVCSKKVGKLVLASFMYKEKTKK